MNIIKRLVNILLSLLVVVVFLFLGFWILIFGFIIFLIFAGKKSGIFNRLVDAYRNFIKKLNKYLNRARGLDEVRTIKRD